MEEDLEVSKLVVLRPVNQYGYFRAIDLEEGEE